ncbi:hypothetical protein U6B65_14055 [Oscillospiraceae bacterium MB08-C2-2]|nr:hypothetical protein U6B65_14055 [Oscillospiraceae bacterium MB08-C2-2]
MNAIIVYYTFGGSTQKEAQRLSKELGAPLCRVREKHRRGLLGSFFSVPAAIGRRASAIQPLGVDLQAYDRIIVGCPIWAGHPAPAFNAIVNLLPAGKEVDLFFCSAGGESKESREGTIQLIEQKGCSVIGYRDVPTGQKPSKMQE